MNDLLLKNQMRKHGDTLHSLALALGLHPHTLYLKTVGYLRGGKAQQFTQSEINTIIKRYSLTPEEVNQIFFGGDEVDGKRSGEGAE